jgi:signal transduction histidine kinase
LKRGPDQPLVTGLARVLGHELGEISALFDGYIGQLEDRAPPQGIASLRRTTQRLRNVYEGLFELAEVAASQPTRSAFDPARSIDAARKRLRARADGKDADIDLRVRPLPTVFADPTQLEQLFTHLLRSAATKASSRNPLFVTGSREGSDVRLNIGSDPQFEDDPAVDGSRSFVGQGMGLALSSHIAELNGGRLWVTSHDRSGTTISLTLPAPES